MEQMKKQEEIEIKTTKRRQLLRKISFVCFGLLVFIILSFGTAIAYNNISLWSDATFAQRLDLAINKAGKWVQNNRGDILGARNAAIIAMLRECNDLKENKEFNNIVTSFLNNQSKHPSRCMKREVDPNWPVIEWELNSTIDSATLDYKWIYYCIAPDKAKFDAEKSGLFDGQCWHRRYLSHQLFALTILRDRQGPNEQLNKLITELCERTKTDMTFCLPVVDIYFQRVAFVLRAGFPQQVRRRWIERIIAEQQFDGGWNDRWLCFTTPRRQLVFNFDEMPSDQHATVQAILALYLVKYRYPEQFGLK
jgi:hypothetical protein